MKKVRLNLKRGVKSWSFVLYDSAESAYFLRNEPLNEDDPDEMRQLIKINPGEFLEIEWMGSEWVYSGATSSSGQDRFDRVRIGKMVPLKNLPKGGIIEVYSGWLTDDEPIWSPHSQKSVRITPIKESVKPKIDLGIFFLDTDEEDLDIKGANVMDLASDESALN